MSREVMLRSLVEAVKSDYDFIIIDCIDCFTENAMYGDFLDFGRLEDLPIENKDRIKRIMDKKDRGRALYISLLLEMKEELLDLFEDISSGKEPTIVLHTDENEIVFENESNEDGYDNGEN